MTGVATSAPTVLVIDDEMGILDTIRILLKNEGFIPYTALGGKKGLEQIAALKEGRIDVGYGRIPFDDAAIERTLLRNERLSAALPSGHTLIARAGPLRLNDLAGEPLVVYPKAPRPSYADQVLTLFRERGLKSPAVYEVRELQTALGLVAAEVGVCLVPVSVEGLRRDNVVYRPLDEKKAVSPIIMSTRKGDQSPEIAFIIKLIREIYRNEGIAFGI